MLKEKKINLIFVIILYSTFFIGVVSIVLHTHNIASELTNTIFGIVHYLMLGLIPLTITVAIIYLVINKRKIDLICLCLSGLSLSWLIVLMYALGHALQGF